jgi:4-aminobutyrate aminotransferase-like enzyme
MSTQTATAGAPSTVATASNYHDYVNPQWVTLLSLLGMNVEYERCFGCELFTKHGRAILDFLSGYCVHNIGELAETSPAFWTQALGMARRAVNI